MRPSRRVAAGTRAAWSATTSRSWSATTSARVAGVVELPRARRRRRCSSVLERHGAMPLPPYITAPLADPERYQTVYAERPGVGRRADRRPPPHRRACSTRSGPRAPRSCPSSSSSGSAPSARSRPTRSRTTRCTPSATACPRPRWSACRSAPAGSWRSARRRCGRSSRRPPPASSRAAPTCSSTATVPFARRRRAAHQLPPAPVVAARAGRRLRRPALARALRRGPRAAATGSCPSATPCSCGAEPRMTLLAWRSPPSAGAGARRARSARPRGEIRTPCFMPVGTRARCARCRPPTSRTSASEIVLGNTYHLMLKPGAERDRPPRRAARLHGLGRPRAHRLGRLPGLLARARRQGASTTTA